MIEVEINGDRRVVEPASTKALRDEIEGCMPAGHVICDMRVNGRSIDSNDFEEFDVTSLRTVGVQTDTPQRIARRSLGETHEWLGRVIGVLGTVAEDYRLGREAEGSARLVEIVDALQVAVGLLSGIHQFLDVDPGRRAELDARWNGAEAGLLQAIEGLFADLDAEDSVGIADRTGYELPRALGAFREILGGLRQ